MINIEGRRLVGSNMRRIIVILLFASLLGQIEAAPEGVGSIADNGCVCHGGADDTTTVTLDGLPDVYNSSQMYNITLTIESPVEENEVQGGFRILISEGEFIGEGWQLIDGGYTHSVEINDRRVWNAVWIAPEDNDTLATFVIHGNAANGDGAASSKDEWNSQSIAVPGAGYSGDITAPEVSNSATNPQKIIGAVALLIVISLAVFAIRESPIKNIENKTVQEEPDISLVTKDKSEHIIEPEVGNTVIQNITITDSVVMGDITTLANKKD